MPDRARGPVLPPLWAERNDVLVQLPMTGIPRRALTTLAGLEAEEARARQEIATGRFQWPPSSEDLEAWSQLHEPLSREFSPRPVPVVSDPEMAPPMVGSVPSGAPSRYHWRHPFCFLNLPVVWEAGQRLQQILLEHGRTPQQAHAEVCLWADILYSQATWAAYGRRVYYLDDTTAELFLQTPLPRFPAEELKVPLPAFVLALPEDRFFFTVPGDPVPQPADSVHVTFTGDEGDPEQDIALLIVGRSPRGRADDNVLSTVVRVRPGMRLDELEPSHELSGPIADDLLRLVLGLCLYLASEHPSVVPVPAPKVEITAKNPAKRRKQEQRASRQSRLGFLWVGPHEGEAGRGAASGEGSHGAPAGGVDRSGARWSLDHALWVQGHWRQQAYGPGHTLRRPQWIKPYEKGPDFAEAVRTRAVQVQPGRRADQDAKD